jgi:hypothetical protein
VTRRLAALVAVVMSAAAPSHAQQALLGPGAAFVSVGTAKIATAELDERLAANGYPTFGRRAATAGIGAYRIVRERLLLGGEFNGLAMDEKPHLGREVGVGGGYATLGVGIVKQLSPRVRLYPRFGLGAGGIALWVESADTTTFDDVLANPPAPNQDRHLSRDGGVIDLGGGLEFLPRAGDWSPLIGVRLGYVAASFGSESNWQMIGGTATGGPSASIAGPYLRVTIGAAWKR